MSIYPEAFHFQGQWRPYQQRVLDGLNDCLADEKIHVVAAPGSGKTTVGLEIVLRLGKPALILSPSIAIREQWAERFRAAFLPAGEPVESWVSQDLRQTKPLTMVTYQALYSACRGFIEKSNPSDEEEDDDSSPEISGAEDDTGFDVVAALRSAGVGTLCLDEAHHLRSEWWKALEQTVGQLGGDLVTVSLTATPPYDAKPAEWARYIGLCGEIDAEIFTPELVKDHNLCPHQDYVYFNWPEKEEVARIRAFRDSADAFMAELSESPAFFQAFASHPGIADPASYAERFLDDPAYLTSLLVFLRHHDVKLSKALRDLIGTQTALPRMSARWMEALLQGFLFTDADSYVAYAELQDDLRGRLAAAAHIQRRTVTLTASEALNRLLVNSKGKLNSIRDITRAEYTNLGGELRLLILTDYIRREALPSLGDPAADVHAIGAVPLFEMLRREGMPGLRLGVLSGSVVIAPRDGWERLKALAAERGVTLYASDLGCRDYVEVTASGNDRKQLVPLMTGFFQEGGIQALIGTKSLLGEGWDSPCVNTLILASFVGSYMLSNQMRGRAIRVQPGNPEKTANIWHLVCMDPFWGGGDTAASKLQAGLAAHSEAAYPVSEDFDLMRRRFKAFLGVSDVENVIQDGVERLSYICPPYDRKHIEQMNVQTLALSADRQRLRKRWDDAIAVCPDIAQVVERNQLEKELIPRGFLFLNAVAAFSVSSAVEGLLFFYTKVIKAYSESGGPRSSIGIFLLMLAVGAAAVYALVRILRFATPQKSLRQFARAVLEAHRQVGTVKSAGARVVTEPVGDYMVGCYLDGAGTYEKSAFADSMAQLLGPIDNPRYILIQTTRLLVWKRTEYYAVPEAFGSREESAAVFERCLRRLGGSCRLVYTRSAEGRRLLLKARARSFGNRNARLLNRNHRVKGKWE